LRVPGEVRRQHLHGDAAIEARVARAPNLPHPARTDARDDLVRAEPRAGSDGHVWMMMPRSRGGADWLFYLSGTMFCRGASNESSVFSRCGCTCVLRSRRRAAVL